MKQRLPTYGRLLARPTAELEALVADLDREERDSPFGSVERRRKLRLLHKELRGRAPADLPLAA